MAKQGIEKQPVHYVTWVSRSELSPNDYNPNAVAPPEMDLLAISIKEDGWTQPIVALRDGTIVDGFHRWTVAARKDVSDLTGGLVPVVYVAFDPVHRMMSTIRHNRARGTHGVLKMAEIVRTLAESGMSSDDICALLKMEDEEVERLLDRSGMTVRGSKGGFGPAWVPTAGE